MKSTSGCTALGALAVLLVLTGPVRAASVPPDGSAVAAADQPPAIRAMTDTEKAAAGCVISSVATMGVVYAIGPSEFVMNVVGGLIVPSSSSVLFVGLLSTIASMACGAGAAITPAVLWGWRQLGHHEEPQGGEPQETEPHAGEQPAAPAATSGRRGFARLDAGIGGPAVIAGTPKAAQ